MTSRIGDPDPDTDPIPRRMGIHERPDPAATEGGFFLAAHGALV